MAVRVKGFEVSTIGSGTRVSRVRWWERSTNTAGVVTVDLDGTEHEENIQCADWHWVAPDGTEHASNIAAEQLAEEVLEAPQ